MDRYAARIAPLGRRLGIGPLTVVEIAESRRASAAERRAEEAKALVAKLPEGRRLALEPTGAVLDSAGFARLLHEARAGNSASLAFVLGGPDGHGEDLRLGADRSLSLGAMTLPHGLARVVLAEQIYRALTILAGHPYHRR